LGGSFLVGGIPTPLKNMSSSVGMMTFPIYGKTEFMFQTTNQIYSPQLRAETVSLKPPALIWAGFSHVKPSDFLTSSSVAARRTAALAVDVAKAAARPTILRQGTLPHIRDPHLALSQNREDKRYE